MNRLPPLPENTILVVEVGSTSHGTGIPGGEDLDLTGVVVETADQVIGMSPPMKNVMQRTVPEGTRSGPGDIDRTLYSLRHFLKLCYEGNPSMLLALWAPVIDSDYHGESLRMIAPAFVGRHVIPKYRGYMKGQMLRLLGLKGSSGHGARGGGRREELIEAHGYDVKYAMHCARLGFQCVELLDTGGLSLPIKGETGDWLRDLRHGEISFEDFFERALWLDAELEKMEKNDNYRPGPDSKVINRYSLITHLNCWETPTNLDIR